jgi:hypothetical protein
MQQVKITVRLSSPQGVAHELFQSAVTQLDPQTARSASQFWHARQELKRICSMFWPTLIVEEVVAVEEL